MTIYVKVENNIVVQKQPYWSQNFVEAPDHVVPGYLYDGVDFTSPTPDPTESLTSLSNVVIYQVSKKGENIGSGQFYDVNQTHNWSTHSGSWSGWNNNIQPLIIPYNCKLVHAYINFRDISFNWRDTMGNVYLDVGFLDHGYNNVFNERILRFELNGDFNDNSSIQNSFRFSVNENQIISILGNNYFIGGEMIGVLLRTDNSIPGGIYSISYPFHCFCFSEV